MHRFGVWGTFRYGVAFLAWQLLDLGLSRFLRA